MSSEDQNHSSVPFSMKHSLDLNKWQKFKEGLKAYAHDKADNETILGHDWVPFKTKEL